LVSYFSGKSLKLLPPDALILAQNTPNCVWRPGSARTRWGSLSAPPDPLAAKGGLLLRGGRGKGEGEGEGEGEGRDFAGPIKIWLLRPWSVYETFQILTILRQLSPHFYKSDVKIWLK